MANGFRELDKLIQIFSHGGAGGGGSGGNGGGGGNGGSGNGGSGGGNGGGVSVDPGPGDLIPGDPQGGGLPLTTPKRKRKEKWVRAPDSETVSSLLRHLQRIQRS